MMALFFSLTPLRLKESAKIGIIDWEKGEKSKSKSKVAISKTPIAACQCQLSIQVEEVH